jgi:hypothetical protein
MSETELNLCSVCGFFLRFYTLITESLDYLNTKVKYLSQIWQNQSDKPDEQNTSIYTKPV